MLSSPTAACQASVAGRSRSNVDAHHSSAVMDGLPILFYAVMTVAAVTAATAVWDCPQQISIGALAIANDIFALSFICARLDNAADLDNL